MVWIDSPVNAATSLMSSKRQDIGSMRVMAHSPI
jgi:hypothetical protein